MEGAREKDHIPQVVWAQDQNLAPTAKAPNQVSG